VKYTVLDVEGLNNSRKSVFEIGLVEIEDNEIVRWSQRRVRPHRLAMKTSKYHVAEIHGVRAEDLIAYQELPAVWPDIADYFDNVVLGHSISWDLQAMRHCLALYGIALPNVRSIDTCTYARQSLPDAEKHGVAFLAEYLGLEHKPHDALSDALTTARIALACAVRRGDTDLETSFNRLGYTMSISPSDPLDLSAWVEKHEARMAKYAKKRSMA
jgi:DNA polymerase-3 subunit epsilon